MSRAYQFSSLLIIALTILWFAYEMMLRHSVQWHFLAAGGINFLTAIIINRQFTDKKYNYLGIIHVVFMVLLFGYGYFFI
ncbi:hypothetical protein [Nonlabens dokdonensis]|jgi:hypothetical protein|uniref:Uncharacterized protein n=1 Tax=Nonlabens dokdonensis (strain DSM 17205 / KCTC 12402 / DSW-6) TaxID=592029 RepID=L7WBX2_NONDD|nr:hypothetical protein [Nonlabens dokdonensis]AGC77604.1 hypothetical protein DDD_2477 [Nonlabens dokdonensis DSW-6]